METRSSFLSVAFENECEYCMAAHNFVGDNMTQVPIEVTNTIRNDSEIPDEKFKALSTFSRTVLQKEAYLRRKILPILQMLDI